MNRRKIAVRRAILSALGEMPDGIMLPDDLLKAEAARLVIPRPSSSELDEQIGLADTGKQIIGVLTDEGTKWKITAAGYAWLAEHR